MAQPNSFQSWRRSALANIDLYYELICDLSCILKSLKEKHPEWRETRKTYPNDYLRHDARYEYFVTILTALENGQLSYIFQAENLTDKEWYIRHNQNLTNDTIQSVCREHSLMVKWFTIHASAMATEETFRAIVRSDNRRNFDIRPRAGASAIYDNILSATRKSMYKPLFEIVDSVRNTLHNNGRHSGPDKIMFYKERKFEFQDGQIIMFLTEECVYWLLKNLIIAMQDIIGHEKISGLSECPRGLPSEIP